MGTLLVRGSRRTVTAGVGPEVTHGGFAAETEPSGWSDAALLGLDTRSIPAPEADLRYNLVLLDRDGTLNRLRPGYVSDPDSLDVLAQAAESVARINQLGARVVLVTNQRGLAHGQLTEQQLVAVHRSLLSSLKSAGGHLDGIQVCGHAEDACQCRKPAPGLIFQAFERASWADKATTLMVGDSDRDEGAAHNAGVKFVRIDDPEKGLAEKIEKVLALCAQKD